MAADSRREVRPDGLEELFPAARVPRRVGAYRVLSALRVEGETEMFLARDEGPLGFHREVTLRCVRGDAEATALRSAELAREARICGRLDHPAIVRVVDFFAAGDRVVLAVEGAEAVTLQDVLVQLLARDDRLSDAAVGFVIATIAEALAHAHATTDEAGAPTPVLHRSVSPSAIVIAADGSVKLSGFAVARILDSTSDSSVGAASGGQRGARRLPPEEAAGGAPSTRGDVWALGTLALQLLGEHDAMASAMHHTIAVPKLASLRPDLPRELCAALDAAAHRDPDKRLSCAVLARWIARVVDLEAGRRDLRACVEAMYGALVRAEAPRVDHRSRRRIRLLQRGTPERRLVRERVKLTAEAEDLDAKVVTDEVVADEAVGDAPAAEVNLTDADLADADLTDVDLTDVDLGDVESTDAEITRPYERPATQRPLERLVTERLVVAPMPALRALVRERTFEPSPEPFSLQVRQALPAKRDDSALPMAVPTPVPRTRMGGRAPGAFSRAMGRLFLLAATVTVLALVTHGRPDTERAARARHLRQGELLAAVSPAPSASVDVPEAPAPATTPLTPPDRKLPNEFGWVHVHASGAEGRVFVAARPWGVPEETIMAPCGRLYVNVAKVDSKGRWAGWTAYGKIAEIPCDGSVAEITLRRPSEN